MVLARVDGRRSSFETPFVGEVGALVCVAAVAAVEAALGVELEVDWLSDALQEVPIGEGAQRLVERMLHVGTALATGAAAAP